MLWEALREEEFSDALERSSGVCVFPIGCLEKHGQHLPVGTDSLVSERLVKASAEKSEVVVFPSGMWLGDVSSYHAVERPSESGNLGFIGINPETLLRVLSELCDEIARNGFKKIIIVNGHGGNAPLLDFFTRAQFYKKRDYVISWTYAFNYNNLKPSKFLETVKAAPEEYPMLTGEDMAALEAWAMKGTGGDHADFRETALLYGACPELVRSERFAWSNSERKSRLGFLKENELKCDLLRWYATNPDCFNAYPPIGCSERIGAAIFEYSVKRLAGIFEAMKKNKECLEVLDEINKL